MPERKHLRPQITLLHEMLVYDPANGVLTWRDVPLVPKQVRGLRAGTVGANGHRTVSVNKALMLASHIAWAMANGEWPPSGFEVDHRNLNKDDDSRANLRLATPSQNCSNIAGRGAASGIKGVYRSGRFGWMSRIKTRGVSVYLGSFLSKEEAAAAYAEASARLHGEFGRTV